ncbi:hypothetical protein [Phenylobacterium sp.]|jgi:hypothetical protein
MSFTTVIRPSRRAAETAAKAHAARTPIARASRPILHLKSTPAS